MHEFSAMQAIVNTILEKLKEYRVERVERVVLEIGKLTFLGSEQLKFAFEILSAETPLKGAVLEIVDIEPEIECEKCGYRGGIPYEEHEGYHLVLPVFRCPECAASVNVVKGKECVVRSVEMVVEDES
ncbi:MAG: hydrogenase maturation nickel metallochaperone HypA [Thermoplasmata archaeon]|nr:hydrogenase maturation nickel metallochaperone HypA [Thermoplasmata archaeon]